jgi:8-amino-7-oxononanoate synthase
MAPGRWTEWVEAELAAVADAGRYRTLRPLDGTGPAFVHPTAGPVVSFASNDYLGLAGHPAVRAAAAEAAARSGAGTGSSRLIVGDRPAHHDLEDELAEWRGADAALVFPSGYQANVAVLTTYGAGRDCRVVSDELNHASIIDGARLSRAEVCVYRHGDTDQAARLVREAPGRCVVVSDSVFSMDGDVAPVQALSEICAHHDALLVLDDAHAVFPLPDVGSDVVCLRVGTLSKALGSQGGFVTGPRAGIDLLVNRARSFIFTTGLAPPAVAASHAALRIVRSAEGAGLIRRLRDHVQAVAPGHPSPIVPVVIGSEPDAVAAADRLLAAGLLVPAIRPPTVPPGTSRLRVSLSAAHTNEEVVRLVAALEPLRRRVGSSATVRPDRPPIPCRSSPAAE